MTPKPRQRAVSSPQPEAHPGNADEGKQLQLRLESYIQRPNLRALEQPPPDRRYDAHYSQINSVFLEPLPACGPRRVQLAMRLTF